MSGLTGFRVMLWLLKYSDEEEENEDDDDNEEEEEVEEDDEEEELKDEDEEEDEEDHEISLNTKSDVTFTAAGVLKLANGKRWLRKPLAVAAWAISYTITSGNNGSVMQISATGVITLAAGKSLDFETTLSYTLVITVTGASGSPDVATLTVNIKNVLEFGKTLYDVCMVDGSTADTTVGTYTMKDNTGGATVTYAITSGELKVSTGKTLAQKTTEKYTVVLAATESGSTAFADPGSNTVSVDVGTCGCSAVAATLGLTLLAVVLAVSA
ncbi:uncharacterized protein LOC127849311 [Dreissena polymorpha]|uniref:uncharacterized protein LOC127849311 n=1 Tax=Dreissena polymorpha TaxID=45954 RepID=UPI00226480C2|nr:uncharacterized protein LOC127849311 [Dreissena polymorpha]